MVWNASPVCQFYGELVEKGDMKNVWILFASLGLALNACQSRDHKKSFVRDAIDQEAKLEGNLAGAFRALILSKDLPFIIAAYPGEEQSKRALPVQVAINGKATEITFKFDHYAGILSPTHIALLNQLLTFRLPKYTGTIPAHPFSDDDFVHFFLENLERDATDSDSVTRNRQMDNGLTDIALSKVIFRRKNCNDSPTIDYVPSSKNNKDLVSCALFRKQKGSGMQLTSLELAAIYHYTEDGGETGPYLDMNGIMRTKPIDDTSDLNLDDPTDKYWAIVNLAAISFFNKADPMPKETYRGVTSLHGSCEGSVPGPPRVKAENRSAVANAFCEYFTMTPTYRDCGFASTSMDLDVAVGFSRDMHQDSSSDLGIVYAIKHKSGVQIDGVSAVKVEREILLPPRTEFRIMPGTARMMIFPAVGYDPKIQKNIQTFSGTLESVPCGVNLEKHLLDRAAYMAVDLEQIENRP